MLVSFWATSLLNASEDFFLAWPWWNLEYTSSYIHGHGHTPSNPIISHNELFLSEHSFDFSRSYIGIVTRAGNLSHVCTFACVVNLPLFFCPSKVPFPLRKKKKKSEPCWKYRLDLNLSRCSWWPMQKTGKYSLKRRKQGGGWFLFHNHYCFTKK